MTTKIDTQTGAAVAKAIDIGTLLPTAVTYSIPGDCRAREIPAPSEMIGADAETDEPGFTVGASTAPITRQDLHLHHLQTVRALLANAPEDLDKFVERLRAKSKQLDKCLTRNLKTRQTAQRPLEAAWCRFVTFHRLASGGAAAAQVKLKVANVSGEDLRKSADLRADFQRQLPKKTSLSQDDLTALIVIPGWQKSLSAHKTIGEMAGEVKAVAIVDAPESQVEAERQCNTGELSAIKGTEKWKERVLMVGNDVRIRQALSRYESPDDDLFVSAAVIKAAMIIRGDDEAGLAAPQAGMSKEIVIETLDESTLKTRWALKDTSDLAVFKNVFVPIVTVQKKLAFWGVETLSTDEVRKQYPVLRGMDFLDKCLIDFLNSRTFRLNERLERDIVRDRVQEFLEKHTGTGESKMLEEGKVVAVKPVIGPDGNPKCDELDVILRIKPKFVTTGFDLQVKAIRTGADGAGGWQKKED